MKNDPAILARVQERLTIQLFRDLDYAFTDAGEGWAEVTLQISPRLHNPYGQLHGGLWTTITDSAMAGAVFTMLEDSQRSATMQLDLRWLRAVHTPTLRAVARVLRRGRRAWHLTAELFDSDGRTVGVANGMFAVLELHEGARE